MAQEIPRVKLKDQVTERIAEMIFSGDYGRGDRLPPERKLVESLGVSRTVVREALNLLESRGLVSVEHGRGAVVSDDGAPAMRDTLRLLLRARPRTMWDLLEVRKTLEVEIASLAAARASEEDIEAMQRSIEAMRGGIKAPEGYVDADVEFHTLLARSAGNGVFLLIIEPITDLLLESRKVTGSRTANARRALKAHETILGKVRNRDPEGARLAMEDHLLATRLDIEKILGEAPETPPED